MNAGTGVQLSQRCIKGAPRAVPLDEIQCRYEDQCRPAMPTLSHLSFVSQIGFSIFGMQETNSPFCRKVVLTSRRNHLVGTVPVCFRPCPLWRVGLNEHVLGVRHPGP